MEIYKDVIGYEGIYKVSNLGNVKTFWYKNEKQMKPSKDKDGYLQLALSKDGLAKTVKVHQLVAESFLNHKRCGFKLVINHIDFNKSNNKVENLFLEINKQDNPLTLSIYSWNINGLKDKLKTIAANVEV